MFGAGCFGLVIGFVAWHVFHAGEAAFGVKQLIAFIGALLGAVVMSAFPAGTTLFAAYSSGLALGFFIVPLSSLLVSVTDSMSAGAIAERTAPSEYPDQIKYIDEQWPEIERVASCALDQHRGTIREYHLKSLPLDLKGRVSVLRRYARTHPDRTSFSQEFLGHTLRSVNTPPDPPS